MFPAGCRVPFSTTWAPTNADFLHDTANRHRKTPNLQEKTLRRNTPDSEKHKPHENGTLAASSHKQQGLNSAAVKRIGSICYAQIGRCRRSTSTAAVTREKNLPLVRNNLEIARQTTEEHFDRS
ncbi:unnamed protein product [Ixodes pacificus]